MRLAKEAGLALTPAGATHPYGEDPQDRTIRLAPTFPPLPEVEKAMAGVAVCVRLALAERGRMTGTHDRTTAGLLGRGELAEDVLTAAVRLLGCTVAADTPEGTVAVRLVEVEAYRGADDPASHSFRGRTPRNGVMFGPPATCTSTSSTACTSAPTSPACPTVSRVRCCCAPARSCRTWRSAHARRPTARRAADLASGPARLASLLGLAREHNGVDVTDPASPVRLLAAPPVDPAQVRRGPRVGVAAAHDLPWRFWLDGSPAVSQYRPGRGAPATGLDAEDRQA